MSFEMSCANCEGRLMVETLGIVVACPHCGTHLSIPAEIPGLTDSPSQPENPAAPTPSKPQESNTSPEDGPDFAWASAMEDEDLPSSFPDFSQGSGSAVKKAASESNVIVSEPETHSETEVPSAVRVANPDPSAVMPAIVTDATASEPVSGFPVLDDRKPQTAPQETAPEQETAEDEQPAEEPPASEPTATQEKMPNQAAPVVVDSPVAASDFLGINIDDDEDDDDDDASPRVGTETTVEGDDFPIINVGVQTEAAEGLPTINTGDGEEAEEFPVLKEGQKTSAPESVPTISTGETNQSENKAPAVAPPVEDAVEETVGEFPVMGSAATGDAVPVPSTAAPKTDPKPKQESAQPTETANTEKPGNQKETVYDSVYNSRRGKIVPHAVFQAWFSYTILITFGLAWAIYRIFTAQTSNLESLPDIKPLKENVRNYVPQKAAMPPGHTLELAQTQRFGNIEVTPLKVTKDNLEIEGWDPEGPVLKLYLKFKNVSNDQTIVPLDGELLFDQNRRRSGPSEGPPANQFICKASEKRKNGEVVLVYARLADLDFKFRNQNLGRALKPGEEVTMYIPSETEGLEYLEGDLIWRVHFRKGHSPKNYGVTTVFEVKFNSSDIQTNSAV